MLSPNQVVKVKAALEKGYIGSMEVFEYAPTEDPITHVTKGNERKVETGIACRLSFTQSPITTNGDVAEQGQTVKVFFDPSVTIKAGSKIVVTQNGVTTEYKHSGVEAVYDTHKEVVLDLFDRWA